MSPKKDSRTRGYEVTLVKDQCILDIRKHGKWTRKQLAYRECNNFSIYVYLYVKFANDTQVFRKVTNDTDKQSEQDDRDKLVKWSENGKCYSILEM